MASIRTPKWAVMTSMLLIIAASLSAQTARWTEAKAKSWYDQQPWIVGSNYIPSDAINELEMWQAQTFNPAQIDKELGWAEDTGMNTMRVFLHDLLWQQDPEGFKKRIDQFLQISSRHHIKPLFVLFDSCWDPQPKLGPQHPPIPGVHNSGWLQSPGSAALTDPTQEARLKTYVVGVVGHSPMMHVCWPGMCGMSPRIPIRAAISDRNLRIKHNWWRRCFPRSLRGRERPNPLSL